MISLLFHYAVCGDCRFMNRHKATSLFCRLGKDCVRAYEDCPVDHWSKKREQTVEEKSTLATEYTKQFGNTAMLLMVKIFCEQDVGMLKQFLQALHFLNNFFKGFA